MLVLVDSARMARLSWIMAASMLTLLCAGCGQGSKRLAGHWRGVRAEGVGPDVQAAANTFAGKMTIDVTGDVIVVTTATDKQSGHYKTVSDDKAKLVIATDKDGPSDPQTFLFPDAKTMKWVVQEGKAIVFVRD
jgi:hypothetical protein